MRLELWANDMGFADEFEMKGPGDGGFREWAEKFPVDAKDIASEWIFGYQFLLRKFPVSAREIVTKWLDEQKQTLKQE
jgi:hypothetical protein